MPDLSDFNKKLKKPMQSIDMEPVEVTASAPAPVQMPESPKVKGESILDNETFQKALIGLAPALIGAIAGGSEGGAIGGKVGSEALASMTEAERKAALAKQEAAQKKAEKEDERKFTLGRDEAKFKHDLAMEQLKEGKKPATADQAKAAQFARRTMQAEDVFSNLEKSGYQRGAGLEGVKSTLGEYIPQLRGSQLQQQEQAERNFVNSVLRRESGAAISPSEFKNAELQYFPRAGDSPEVLEQKKLNRQQVIAGLAGEAGEKAMGQIQQIAGSGQVMQKKSGMPDIGMSAQASQKPDFSKMSEAELKKYLGR